MNESPKSSEPRIVILGGGFGGTYTAMRLEQLARRQPMKISLLNRNNYFLMTPLLFEAGSGILEPRHAVSPIRSLLTKTRFIQGEIQSVDFERKVVITGAEADPNHEIPFDHLVVALGGTTNLDLIPGSDHALTFKTLADAIFLRNHVIECFERADIEKDPDRRAAMLAFVIVGAGLVGVELAGELSEFIQNIRQTYKNIDPTKIRMELIEAGKRIMPEVEPQLSDYATRVLSGAGVRVQVLAPVKSIESGKINLPSESIDSETIIVATGVKPSPLVDKLDLPKSKKGRIITDGTMLVQGKTDIWALGDCAAIPDPSSTEGRPYPQLAQHALREAKLLAENIVASLRKEKPKPFIYSNKGILASLGHFRGTGRVYKFRIYGFVAWWVWRTYYLLQMPRWSRRMRIIIDWTVGLFFKNDIVELDLFGTEHPLERPLVHPAVSERV